MRHHLLRLEGALLAHTRFNYQCLIKELLQFVVHHLLLLHLEQLAPARLLDLPLLIAMAAAFAVEGGWQALDEFAAVVVQSWLLRLRPEWVA
jgi:hypothetical protein